MNTFNSAVKNKEIQCERLGSQVSVSPDVSGGQKQNESSIQSRAETHTHRLLICTIQYKNKPPPVSEPSARLRATMRIVISVNQTKRTHETQTVDDGLVQTSKSRSASSAVEKSHGTRLSDQSMDETMRKPSGHKSKVDEAKVPEPFDVSNIHFSMNSPHLLLGRCSRRKSPPASSLWNVFSISIPIRANKRSIED